MQMGGGRGRMESLQQLFPSFSPGLARGVVASFSFPFSSTFLRGADGFLEAPVPKWVLEFKITHFSKREPPPQAKGENGPFFF